MRKHVIKIRTFSKSGVLHFSIAINVHLQYSQSFFFANTSMFYALFMFHESATKQTCILAIPWLMDFKIDLLY